MSHFRRFETVPKSHWCASLKVNNSLCPRIESVLQQDSCPIIAWNDEIVSNYLMKLIILFGSIRYLLIWSHSFLAAKMQRWHATKLLHSEFRTCSALLDFNASDAIRRSLFTCYWSGCYRQSGNINFRRSIRWCGADKKQLSIDAIDGRTYNVIHLLFLQELPAF